MRFITFILLFTALNSSEQEISKDIQITEGSDTAFWAKYHFPDIEKLSLISPNENTNFFRISSSKYYLELSEHSNKIFFYVNEIWDNQQTGEAFIKSYEIKPDQIKKITALIDLFKINEIPSDKFIKKWTHGFDGITYIIENKTDNLYSFKNYWTPSSQENFEQAEAILKFTNQLDEIVEYITKRKEFEKEIPFYGWTYNGSMIITRVISDTKAYLKYKRTKKKQLKNKD
ncbi:MAG TPA: hypothetical protein PKW69_00385 [Niabella sp.]|nr:hypothetical protein [Niabella sp.]